MELTANARRAPLRLTTGAFVINSGVGQFGSDNETSRRLQAAAAKIVPQAERIDPKVFAKALGVGEVTLGTALLLPVVPPAIAGLGLSALAASLLATHGSSNGQHATGADENTASAMSNATEAWMLGSGVSLLLDALTTPAHDKTVEMSAKLHEKAAAKKRHLRRSRRKAAALAALSSAQLGDKAHVAGERLHEVGERASERVAELRDEYQPVATKKLKRARKKAGKKAKLFAEAARDSAESAVASVQQAVA